jgi:hypothetical protein
MTSNLKSLSAYEFTNFVRGELFVAIDCLMTTLFDSPASNAAIKTEADLALPFELFKAYIQLYCLWLKILPDICGVVSPRFYLI